jgi:hypothetical protein
MSAMVGNVLEMQFSICFEKMEDGEEKRDKSAAHTFALRGEG